MKTLLLFFVSSVVLAGSPQSVPVHSQASIGTSSTLALAANKDRGYLMIQNKGGDSCQVKFGSAITGTEGILITAGQYYEPVEAFLKSAVYMSCTGSGNNVVFLEGNW